MYIRLYNIRSLLPGIDISSDSLKAQSPDHYTTTPPPYMAYNILFLFPGTFAGRTTLSIALALPTDGEMVTIDFKDEWVAIGRKIWAKV